MSHIGDHVAQLLRCSLHTATVLEIVRRAQRDLSDLLDSLRRVLADSRADEVAHAHAVVAAAADDLSRVEAALIECTQITEARAQSL